MGWVVTVMLDSLIGWMLELLADLMGYIGQMFAGIFGADPRAFLTTFPVIWNVLQGFYGVGTLLAIVLLILGCLKNMMSGLGVTGENPFKMITRFIFSLLMVFTLPYVLCMVYTTTSGSKGLFQSVYEYFGAINAQGSGLTATISGFVSHLLQGGAGALLFGSAGGTVSMVILCIILVVLGMNMLKLLLEMVERYLLLNLLIFCSPLAASSFALESTSKIFSSYLKMYFGQLMMILFNLITCKIVEGGLTITGDSFNGGQTNGIPPIAMLLLIIAMLKVAQRIDNYMRDIGLTVGVTGGNLTDEILGSMGAVKGIFAGGTAVAGKLGFNVHNPFAKGKIGRASAAGVDISGASPATMNNGVIGYGMERFRNYKAGKDAVHNAQKTTPMNRTQAREYEENYKATHAGAGSSVGTAAAIAVGSMLHSEGETTRAAGTSEATKKAAKNTLFDNDGRLKDNFIVENQGKAMDFKSLANGDIKYNAVGSGGAIFHSESGHRIKETFSQPEFKDSSYTELYDTKMGQTIYLQDLDIANREYQESHNGENLPAYDNMIEQLGSNSEMLDFRPSTYMQNAENKSAPTVAKKVPYMATESNTVKVKANGDSSHVSAKASNYSNSNNKKTSTNN